MEHLVSVIVPVYNVEQYLERCVNSIMEQTYTHLEIILIDDGSTDNSGYICDEYKKKDKRIKVVHKTNGGLSSARNAGLDICRGEYIAFVDSDDWVEKEMYSALLDLCLHNNADIAIAGKYNVDAETGIKKIGHCPQKEEILTNKSFFSKLLLGKECDSSMCDKLYHYTIWKNVRFPIGRINEDIAISHKIAFTANRIIMCPQPFYNYFHRKGSITTTFNNAFFDCDDFSLEILDWIRINHQELLPEATYFRIVTIAYLITVLLEQPKSIREKYKGKYRKYIKEIKDFKKNWLHSNLYTKKQKIKYILIILHLYGFIKKIYIGIKRK